MLPPSLIFFGFCIKQGFGFNPCFLLKKKDKKLGLREIKEFVGLGLKKKRK